MASSKTAKRNRRRAKQVMRASRDDKAAFEFKGNVSFGSNIAAAGDGDVVPSFRLDAYTGGKMQPPGFSVPIVVDLDGLEAGSQVPVFLDHEISGRGLVGHANPSVINGHLFADGVVSADTDAANLVVKSAKRGFPWQCSIGGGVSKKTFVKAGETRTINGRVHEGPFFQVKAKLQEVSFVPIGADSETSASIAAALAKVKGDMNMSNDKEKVVQGNESESDGKLAASTQDNGHDDSGEGNATNIDPKFREWIESRGEVVETLVAEDLEELQAEYELQVDLTNARDIVGREKTMLKRMRARAATEEKRQEKIRELCKHDPELRSQAILEGWDTTKVELEMFRNQLRIQPLSNGSGARRTMSQDAIEAALCSQMGVPLEWLDSSAPHWKDPLLCSMTSGSRGYNEQTLDMASNVNEYSFGRLFHDYLAANGQSSPSWVSMDDLANQVRQTHYTLRASTGFSTMNLSGILSNVLNKRMLASFETVRPVAQSISNNRPVNDFKDSYAYRLTAVGEFLPVGPTGELKAGGLQQEEYSARAQTYGRLISVSREMLINDDLGALGGVTRTLGRMAAIKLQKVFFTSFLGLEAAGHFSAGHANLLTGGAGYPLSIANLTLAEKAFLTLKDANSDYISVEPAILLVPPTLKVTAEELMNATQTLMLTRDAAGAADVRYPDINPHAGKWRIEWSPWLEDATLTGYDDGSFYLLANPNELALMEIVYLKGRKVPVIEGIDMPGDVLGMAWRAYFDFGVATQDWRAGVKAKDA